jgi:hypothetical protein
MDFWAIVPAVVYGLMGLSLILIFLGLIIRAVVGDSRGWAEKLKFRQK